MEEFGCLAPAWRTRQVSFEPDDSEDELLDGPIGFYAEAAQRAADRNSLLIDLERLGVFDDVAIVPSYSDPVAHFPCIGPARRASHAVALEIGSNADIPKTLPTTPADITIEPVMVDTVVAGDVIDTVPKIKASVLSPIEPPVVEIDHDVEHKSGCVSVLKPYYNLFVTPWTFVRMVAASVLPPGFVCTVQENEESLYLFARWRGKHVHCRIDYYDDVLSGSSLRFLELYEEAGGRLEGFHNGLGSVFASAIVGRFRFEFTKKGYILHPRSTPLDPDVLSPKIVSASSRLTPYLAQYEAFARTRMWGQPADSILAFLKSRLVKSVRLFEDVFYFIRACSSESDVRMMVLPPVRFPFDPNKTPLILHEVVKACGRVFPKGFGKLCVMIRNAQDLESLAWFALNLGISMSIDDRVQHGSYVLVVPPSYRINRMDMPQSFRHLQNLTGVQVILNPLWPDPGPRHGCSPSSGEYVCMHYERTNLILVYKVVLESLNGLPVVKSVVVIPPDKWEEIREDELSCPYLLPGKPPFRHWSRYAPVWRETMLTKRRPFYVVESHHEVEAACPRAIPSPYVLAPSVFLSFGSCD